MLEKLKKNFIKLAEIDSISGEERRIKEYICERSKKKNLRLHEDKFGNLFSSNRNAKILLTAHLDTVEPGRGIHVVEKNGVFTSDGKTIVGGDNKAGLAVIITLLEYLAPSLREKVEVLFTVQEEKGLRGARNFDIKNIHAKFGICLDKSDSDFGKCLVIGSGAAEVFEMTLIGKEHHSSRQVVEDNPLNLYSSIFSKLKIGPLNRYISFNVGEITGFHQLNSSPRQLVIKGDVRSSKQSHIESFYKRITQLVERSHTNCECIIHREKIATAFRLSKNEHGYGSVIRLLNQLGFKPDILISGSMTDALVLSANGLPTYLLSCGVFNTHQTNERVKAKEMLNAYMFLKLLIQTL